MRRWHLVEAMRRHFTGPGTDTSEQIFRSSRGVPEEEDGEKYNPEDDASSHEEGEEG